MTDKQRRRVKYLAVHAKKLRVRKKNLRRLTRDADFDIRLRGVVEMMNVDYKAFAENLRNAVKTATRLFATQTTALYTALLTRGTENKE